MQITPCRYSGLQVAGETGNSAAKHYQHGMQRDPNARGPSQPAPALDGFRDFPLNPEIVSHSQQDEETQVCGSMLARSSPTSWNQQ